MFSFDNHMVSRESYIEHVLIPAGCDGGLQKSEDEKTNQLLHSESRRGRFAVCSLDPIHFHNSHNSTLGVWSRNLQTRDVRPVREWNQLHTNYDADQHRAA